MSKRYAVCRFTRPRKSDERAATDDNASRPRAPAKSKLREKDDAFTARALARNKENRRQTSLAPGSSRVRVDPRGETIGQEGRSSATGLLNPIYDGTGVVCSLAFWFRYMFLEVIGSVNGIVTGTRFFSLSLARWSTWGFL